MMIHTNNHSQHLPQNIAESCPRVEKLWLEGDDELGSIRIILVSVIAFVLYLASSYALVVINDV